MRSVVQCDVSRLEDGFHTIVCWYMEIVSGVLEWKVGTLEMAME